MEWILGIGLFLSLWGNLEQHETNKELKAEVIEAQEIAEHNRQQWLNVIEVNTNNASTIADLKNAIDDCDRLRTEALAEVNQFRDVSSIQGAAIEALEKRVADTDFNECRVPDWVVLTTP